MKKASRGAPVTSSSQQQVRQVVTPVRPVSQKTKHLEAQIAKLQSELDLN
jgi:signal transduction histidine kinase